MFHLSDSMRAVLVWLRLGSYALVSATAGAVIGLCAYLEYIQHWHALSVYLFPFIVGIITLLIVLPLAVLDRLRRDAAVHQPRVELVWAGLVMLLWLASALYFTLKMDGFPKCSVYRGLYFDWNHNSEETWCRIHTAVEALLWFGFAMLISIMAGIFFFAVLNTERGYGEVWETAISDFEREPKEAPSAQFIREQERRQRDIEATFENLRFQQRYRAAVSDSEPSQPSSQTGVTRPRPPSPTLSVRSALHAMGYVPQRHGSDLVLSTREGSTMAQAQHSSNSLLSGRNPSPPRPVVSSDTVTEVGINGPVKNGAGHRQRLKRRFGTINFTNHALRVSLQRFSGHLLYFTTPEAIGHVVGMNKIDELFDAAGAAAGVHGSQFKLLACFVISYPLGSVFVRLPKESPAVKHAFSIAVSMFFLLGMLNLWGGTESGDAVDGFLVGPHYPVYQLASRGMLMSYFSGGSSVTMGHLLISHWIRYKWPSAAVEISGPQMVLTQKLTTYAWNAYDGYQKLENLDESQKETRIPQRPSLLEFFGYVFYFPAFLVGPVLTFSDYMALVNETVYGAAANGNTKRSSKRVPSGRKRVAYRKLLTGVACLGMYAVYDGKFSYQLMLQSSWMTKPFWYRVLHTQAMGTMQRIKYYGAWSMTEGACIFTGYGFNGFKKDGTSLWNKAANIDILNIELAPNFKILLDNWNINTNVWLRNSVYKRLVPPGKKPTAVTTMQTFMTSAVWHGIYPGYYLTFFLGGLVSSAAKQARTYIRPFFLPAILPPPPKSKVLPPPPATLPKRVYDVIGTITTLFLINYLVAPFMLLNMWDSITAWNSLYWYGHVTVAAWLAWGHGLGGFAMLKKMLKKRADAAGTKEALKVKADMEERERVLAAGVGALPSGAVTPSVTDPLMVAPVDAAIAELHKMEGAARSRQAAAKSS
ncbi:lysophospholipid acyltransferase [Tulasnella sp. 403]|nr:lysophospholipid acyltransferase [Tulasnella sp. 403]